MIDSIKLLFSIVFVLFSVELHASQQLWQSTQMQTRGNEAGEGYFTADNTLLRARLGQAPDEILADRSYLIELPMPDGSLESFAIVESPIMHADLAQRYPEIKTYRLYGIDGSIASGRADMTQKGFHAMLQSSHGLVFIDPDETSNTNRYRSRRRNDQPAQGFSCGVHRIGSNLFDQPETLARPRNRLVGSFLTYRLAVAATQEYVAAVGGTIAAAQAEIVTAINRVNVFYERDLGIRLLLVGKNDSLLERADDTCLTNNNAVAMLGENQLWIDGIIGSSSYDVGHVFATSSGGVAVIESVCDANFKAGGVTGLSNPTGDRFYIDYVAHEIGHQFGAEHVFNGTTNSCDENRVAASAVEPGSGSTIMGYASPTLGPGPLCGGENLQDAADATFHAGSISQIDAFTGAIGNCYIPVANGNSDPTLSTISNRVIPKDTPFRLDNPTAMDADPGDSLSYQWDQIDAGGTATTAATFGQDLGDNPLFRSYPPQPVSYRDFPALGTQLQGMYDEAEVMACSSRNLNFRLTVRDNASGQTTDDVQITVNRNAGPFAITSLNTVQTLDLVADAPFTLDWDVANTGAGSPVNCVNVDIELLTFDDAGYTNYSVHPILAGTPNDGTEDINITPTTDSHPRARIRVKCSDNVFYDISDADLNLVGSNPPAMFGDTDNVTFFNSGSTLVGLPPVCGVPRSASADRAPASNAELVNVFYSEDNASRTAARECIPGSVSRSSNGDASSFGYSWLLMLGGLAAFRRVWRRQG